MAVTVATVDLDRLSRRYGALQLRFAALQGRAAELQTQKTKLSRDIALAKGRIELAPEAAEAFKYLQDRAHADAVGEFEDLLSAFVADVVPDAGKVHLELSTKSGAPALDILLDNGGDLENILEGNGGGLTNVVVTGLGFSALSRTANRQLMVLDEPDCWLKAKYVPNFTKVIAEVANPRTEADGTQLPGCQTLMISHNDISLMDEGAHIQDLRIEYDLKAFADRLGVPVEHKGEVGDCAHVVWVPAHGARPAHLEVRYREDGLGDEEQNALTKGFPYIEAIGGARAWPDDMPGIRWVEVINLRRHVMSRLELSPGLNVLTGDINGGKSTLYFTALRAMAYGETDDTMIRHGADCAVVRMGLENDVVLEMVRNRKGAPKVLYRRYEGGVLVNEGRQETRSDAPSFITDVLRIERVDDLDIQLRSQKQPVFLLNEPAARRAQLLSVGRESGLLQALIERHRLQNRRDKEQLKRDELELNLVTRTLTVLSPLGEMAGLQDIMNDMLSEAQAKDAKVNSLRALVGRLAPLDSRARLWDVAGEDLKVVIKEPVYVQTKPLAALIARLERTQLLAQLPDLKAGPAAPELKDTKRLSTLLLTIKRGETAQRVAALLPIAPVQPQLADTNRLALLLSTLIKGQSAERAAGLLPEVPTVPQLKDGTTIRRDGVSLSRKQEAVQAQEKDDATAQAEVKSAEDALHKLKHELGVCPTCHQAFREESHV
ncbi:TPA: AAA family ATPase [Burkholderia vietnamiensis]|nr:AAA family ATPase [Burkholderia vietnamiensis]